MAVEGIVVDIQHEVACDIDNAEAEMNTTTLTSQTPTEKPEPETTSADRQPDSDDKYDFDVVNEGIEKRLKFFNVCCSQGGCK